MIIFQKIRWRNFLSTGNQFTEVDDNLAIVTCRRYNYKYTVITPNDIIIPPKVDDNFSKN